MATDVVFTKERFKAASLLDLRKSVEESVKILQVSDKVGFVLKAADVKDVETAADCHSGLP
ncbi:hypothetical protein ACHJH3_11015 [Campylobacter sp. MOP7]|uniref:hypothetical protein n=1 Tax=Campylobacter canis TaxID=3378588 RepID=UPI00387EC4BD